MKRLIIYPKDIQIITGRSERYSRKLLEKIRRSLGRAEDGLVTVTEFCNYTGLQLQEIEKTIKLD